MSGQARRFKQFPEPVTTYLKVRRGEAILIKEFIKLTDIRRSDFKRVSTSQFASMLIDQYVEETIVPYFNNLLDDGRAKLNSRICTALRARNKLIKFRDRLGISNEIGAKV